jgi:hypothetical protein
VSGETGLVILATSHGQKRYAHAEMALVAGGKFDEGGADTTPPTLNGTSAAADRTGVAVGAGATAQVPVGGSFLLFLLLVPLVRRLRS